MKIVKIERSSHIGKRTLYMIVPISIEEDPKAIEKSIETYVKENGKPHGSHYVETKWSVVSDTHSQVIAINNEFHRLATSDNITFEEVFTFLEAMKTLLLNKMLHG